MEKAEIIKLANEYMEKELDEGFRNQVKKLLAEENADLVGTELTWNIHNYVLEHIEDSHRPSPLLDQMKAEGKMGCKSGEGFYQWTEEDVAKCNADLNTYLIRMLYQ